MIYCPQCGTPNKPNSKFCKNCAALLAPSTDVRCPICGTMNPQGATACTSCGTRLSTTTTPSDKTSPADTPESITPFTPPEATPDSDEAESGDKSSARPTFSSSSSEWLRRVKKTPPAETAAPLAASAAAASQDSPLAAASGNEVPEWLREIQAEADKQAAEQNAATAPTQAEDELAAGAAGLAVAGVAALSAEPETPASAPPVLSEIKLTRDDYDYSDIGGQVTDEMKAELEAQAGSAESVDDEVALARRLLGLEVAQEVVSSFSPAAERPLAEATTPPIAESATGASALAPEAETPAPTSTAVPVVQAGSPATAPALSEIKLTRDDYDYSDIGGQVTDEMKAELEAQAGSAESVDDEVALARRLLGLEVAQEVVTSSPAAETPVMASPPPPIAETAVATSALAPEAETQAADTGIPAGVGIAAGAAALASRDEAPVAETAPSEVMAEPVAETTPTAQVTTEEDEGIPAWLKAAAVGTTAAVVKTAQGEPAAASTPPPGEEAAVASPVGESVPTDAEAAVTVPVAEAAPIEADAATVAPVAAVAAQETAESSDHEHVLAKVGAAAAVASAVLGGDKEEQTPAQVTQAELAGAELPQAQESPPELPVTDKGAPALESGEMPDWVRELAPPDVVAADAVAKGEASDTMPDWMRTMAPVGAVVGTSALLARVPDLDEEERDDLPDWLREPVEPAAGVSEKAAASAGAAAALELPAWFADTSTGAAGRDPFEVVETTGPLAGVSGILPLAIAITEPHTLTTPTPVRSDGGRIFQTLLAEPLASSTRASAESQKRRLFTANHLLYLLIALAALIPLFLPLDQAGLGLNATQSSTAGFYDQLLAVPPSDTVLMAFEYTPGQGVELDPAAQAILNELASQSIGVIALSTNPNGAAIAQGILQRTAETHPGFTFVNIGYIPGNEAGLRLLATGWLPASLEDVQGVPWASSPFAAQVSSMDDLALSILLAGDDPTLRAWMEQVEPRVASPFISATTATLEPQARNYVNSKQLQASLRGLTGAAELELLTNETGQAVKTVDALSVVSLVLAGIIIVANVVFLIKRRK